MPCNLEAYGDPCECMAGLHYGIPKIYCPHWSQPLRPYNEVERWSIANWCTMPLAIRERCLKHLTRTMYDHPEALGRFVRAFRDGMAPGSDDAMFHFSAGMGIRNVLRQVCSDAELPAIKGQRNWDDYYVGAIAALCHAEVARVTNGGTHDRL